MKNAKPKADVVDMAVAMREAAALASEKAKDTLIQSVEESLPEEDDPANAQRQLGALITAVSGLYADMLQTIAALHDRHNDSQAEAQLAVGCLKKLIAEPMLKVGAIADGVYKKD